MKRRSIFAVAVLTALTMSGCGSSAPEHPVKPLAVRPAAPSQSFNTVDDKIRYIENSKAPESVKKSAIERLRSGR